MVVLAAQQEEAAFNDFFAHIIMEFLRAHIQTLVIHYDRLPNFVFPLCSAADTLTTICLAYHELRTT